ncbi:hypothetical protein TIFTF001_013288 [Ficus carica]|uniref:Uncharacterized protein n=1 Tax=Ficus carica TaxID=3494 RepID=A0AA88DI85_FICCA|nr:hypothetical protein TIFTF001_013288 [Ficus carica]
MKSRFNPNPWGVFSSLLGLRYGFKKETRSGFRRRVDFEMRFGFKNKVKVKTWTKIRIWDMSYVYDLI